MKLIMLSIAYVFLEFVGKYFSVFVSVTHQSIKADQHKNTVKHKFSFLFYCSYLWMNLAEYGSRWWKSWIANTGIQNASHYDHAGFW